MIVKMSRVYIAVSQADRDRLLDWLGRMELLHFEPVRPDEAVLEEETLQKIEDVEHAMEILSPLVASGKAPCLSPMDAAREAVQVEKATNDGLVRLKELERKLEELEIWGNVTLAQLAALQESGIEVRFFQVPGAQVSEVRAECAEVLSSLPGNRVAMAVVARDGQPEMPEGSEILPLPSQDRPSVLEEAKRIREELKRGHERLSRLAGLKGALKKERDRLLSEAALIKGQRSGLVQGELYGVQGWLPEEEAEKLPALLGSQGLSAAVRRESPLEEDDPPTLIRYHPWAKPIKGLFDVLGTLPGYREADLSPFFMVALPVFAAMLIGDAGYGLLISLFGLIFWRRLLRAAGRPKAQIVVVFGLATLAWGVLTANYFGVTPATLEKGMIADERSEPGDAFDDELSQEGNGLERRAAILMKGMAPLWREDTRAARFLLIKISLIIGCIHLLLARLRRMFMLVPDKRALAEVGWMIVLADMLVLIWHLLFLGVERTPGALWLLLLAALCLSSYFSRSDRNPAKRFLLGLVSSMLPFLGTFSDTMSYIRLFAVGLASFYIASAFNVLAVKLAGVATWFAAIPVLAFGHGLNMGLAVIAIFAHGVRLNMLEFSNNVGVQWGGHAYRPFSTVRVSGQELLRR